MFSFICFCQIYALPLYYQIIKKYIMKNVNVKNIIFAVYNGDGTANIKTSVSGLFCVDNSIHITNIAQTLGCGLAENDQIIKILEGRGYFKKYDNCVVLTTKLKHIDSVELSEALQSVRRCVSDIVQAIKEAEQNRQNKIDSNIVDFINKQNF
jgi:hypothetical protein